MALYRSFRRRAALAGLDVIMVEHRGVGLSRHDDSGTDLPPEALSVDAVVDDIAAVLDDAQVDKAIVYGTSYGTYLAAGLGVRHPARIHAMVLDSPLLSADDIDDVRAQTRRVLWDGVDPGSADLASKVRRLVADGVLDLDGRPDGGRPVRHSRARRCCDANWTCCWPATTGCGRRWDLGTRQLLGTQDSVPPRARSRRAHRVPRAELRRRP